MGDSNFGCQTPQSWGFHTNTSTFICTITQSAKLFKNSNEVRLSLPYYSSEALIIFIFQKSGNRTVPLR